VALGIALIAGESRRLARELDVAEVKVRARIARFRRKRRRRET
jgi:hypothetical protein